MIQQVEEDGLGRVEAFIRWRLACNQLRSRQVFVLRRGDVLQEVEGQGQMTVILGLIGTEKEFAFQAPQRPTFLWPLPPDDEALVICGNSNVSYWNLSFTEAI